MWSPAQLREQIVKAGGQEVLEVPLTEIADELDDEQTGPTLLEIGDAEDAETLGDLFASAELPRQLRESFDDEGAELGEALVDWARQRALGSPGARIRWRPRAAPDGGHQDDAPADRKALIAWAEEHGAAAVLDAPVRTLRPWLEEVQTSFRRRTPPVDLRRAEQITFREVLERARLPRGLVNTKEGQDQLIDAIRLRLAYEVARVQTRQRRETLWSRTPDDPALARLASRLHDALTRVQCDPSATLPVFYEDNLLKVHMDPPALSVDVGDTDLGLGYRAYVEVAGFEHVPVRTSCSCRAPGMPWGDEAPPMENGASAPGEATQDAPEAEADDEPDDELEDSETEEIRGAGREGALTHGDRGAEDADEDEPARADAHAGETPAARAAPDDDPASTSADPDEGPVPAAAQADSDDDPDASQTQADSDDPSEPPEPAASRTSSETAEATARACPHVRVLLEWAVDAVHDPEHPLHEAVAQLVRTPSWSRLVEALSNRVGAAASRDAETQSPEQRLVWRLWPLAGSPWHGLHIEPAIQRRTRRGTWSRGKSVRLEWLSTRDPEGVDLDSRDRIVASVLSSPHRQRNVLDIREHDAVAVLRALVDHPRVVSGEDPTRTLDVHPVTPTLAATPQGDEGVRLEVWMRGHRVLASGDPEGAPQASRDVPTRGALVHLDTGHGECLFAEIDDRLGAALDALRRYPAALPPQSYDTLLQLLPRLQPAVQLDLPEAVRGEERPPDPRPVVRLEPVGDTALRAEVRVRPLPGADARTPGNATDMVLSVDAEGQRIAARRDPASEHACADEVVRELGLQAYAEAGDGAARWRYRVDDADPALDLLATLRAHSRDLEIEWPRDASRWRVTGTARARGLRVRVRRADQWFGVDGEVDVDGEQVSLATLLEAVRAGRRYTRVGPGRFAQIERELRDRLASVDDVLFQDGQQLAVGTAAADRVEQLVDDPDDAIDADRAWHETRARMEEARTFEPSVPGELEGALRSYQRQGHDWLARLGTWGAGGCLADEMGLGKTVQALAALRGRADRGPALVVAPTSVLPGWEQEAARFTPSLRVIRYHGPGRRARLEGLGAGDLVITSYDVLARDAEHLAEIELASLVLDEAQAIKNTRTRRARAVRQLDAAWCIALTGTPLENHLGELWSVFRVVSPGLLGSWEHFRARFAVPIERDGDTDRRQALSKLLRPFLLRRTKAEVEPDLPPRTEVTQPVELSADERARYEAARREALEALADVAGDGSPQDAEAPQGNVDPKARFQILAHITRLRRLACHPRLVDEHTSLHASKLNTFLELAGDLRADGHRALVFSQFTDHLALVREALEARGVDYLYLDGSTPARRRAELVERWQAGETSLFLISLRAGGTGLNLTGADYVVHLDPWWNPAVEDQASDRAHRIGQWRPVTVVRLVTQGTIEEAVVALHAQKRELAEGILEGGQAAAQASTDELLSLIRGDSTESEPVDEAPSTPPGEGPPERGPASDAESTDSAEVTDGNTSELTGGDAATLAAGRTHQLTEAESQPAPDHASPSTATSSTAEAGSNGGLLVTPSELPAVAEAFTRHLDAELHRGAISQSQTVRNYGRAVQRFVDYVREAFNGANGGKSPRPFEQLRDDYIAALDRGDVPAPKSDRVLARTALSRMHRFLQEN